MSAPSAFPATLPIPEPVRAIIARLEEAGFETWAVGGAIRDLLLGSPNKDVDLATAATPDKVRALFRRTVPIGIEHGTIGVLDDDGLLHEITTFRKDVKTDGRHAVVEFGVSLDDDLARRDFTINAIAFHPLKQLWRDPFDGRGDLDRKIIRAVGDPLVRFREDRLRVLRALRFCARYGFEIERRTSDALIYEAAETGFLSAERVRDEWVKGIATARDPSALVALWRTSGVAAVWLPELQESSGLRPVLSVETRDPVIITAACCRPSGPVWRRLKGSNAEIARAEAMDRGPAAPASAEPAVVRQWMARVGEAAGDFVSLEELAAGSPVPWTAEYRAIKARGEATSRGQLNVGGNDLRAIGIPAGPEIGRTLQRLLDAVLEDPSLNQRDRLLELARGTP